MRLDLNTLPAIRVANARRAVRLPSRGLATPREPTDVSRTMTRRQLANLMTILLVSVAGTFPRGGSVASDTAPDRIGAVAPAVDPADEPAAFPDAAGAPSQAAGASDSPDDLVALADLANGVRVDVAKLVGADEKLGEREAYRLLSSIAALSSDERPVHLRFLAIVLAPADVARLDRPDTPRVAERLIAVRRILAAIPVEIADGDGPLEGIDRVLLPLLGVGPVEVRTFAVAGVRALAERESGRSTSLLDEIGAKLEHNPPPSAALLEDASQVLWEADGKRFLQHAITGMMRNHLNAPGSTESYLRELRSRVWIDFPTLEGWQSWWEENAARSLPKILVDVQRRLSAEETVAWRHSLERLRDTGDGDRLLAELEATVRGSSLVEKRLAAVAALGEFAEWVRAIKPAAVEGDIEKQRAAAQARACGFLIDIGSASLRVHELPQIRRAALTALRRHQSFLERADDALRARVVELVVSGFASVFERSNGLDRTSALDRPSAASAETSRGGRRTALLELVRVAGALRVLESRAAVESILDDPALGSDLEIARASVQALGRMLKNGLGLETVERVFRHFGAVGGRTDTEALELRVDCASALDARPNDDRTRERLRTFHASLLAQHEEPRLHIPAIGGLSTLAQENDAAALAALVSILGAPERFDTPALVAVVNAVAYIGGQAALEQFVPFLRSRSAQPAKEQAVAEHLLETVRGIVRREGVAGLDWLLEQLENRAYLEDDPSFLAWGLDLVRDAEIASWLLLAADGAAPANERLRVTFSATIAHLRALAVTRGDSAAAEIWTRVNARVAMEPELAELAPEIVAEVALRRQSRELRAQIEARLAAPGDVDLAAVLADLARLVRGAGSTGVEPTVGVGATTSDPAARARRSLRSRWVHLRWIESLLASPSVRTDTRLAPLVGMVATYLAASDNDSLWRGLPQSFRDAYLRRLATRATPEGADDALGADSPRSDEGGRS